MLQFVFRLYTQVWQTICSSVSLWASLTSPFSSIVHHLSGSNRCVACQKTNAGWNEYCHSSKLKHENWNMDEWMQNAISFWTAALCHQRSQLWSVHLWSSARPPTEASWMCGASENSVQSLLQLFMASALRVLEAGFALNTQGSLVWVGHHIFNDLILNSHV